MTHPVHRDLVPDAEPQLVEHRALVATVSPARAAQPWVVPSSNEVCSTITGWAAAVTGSDGPAAVTAKVSARATLSRPRHLPGATQ